MNSSSASRSQSMPDLSLRGGSATPTPPSLRSGRGESGEGPGAVLCHQATTILGHP